MMFGIRDMCMSPRALLGWEKAQNLTFHVGLASMAQLGRAADLDITRELIHDDTIVKVIFTFLTCPYM